MVSFLGFFGVLCVSADGYGRATCALVSEKGKKCHHHRTTTAIIIMIMIHNCSKSIASTRASMLNSDWIAWLLNLNSNGTKTKEVEAKMCTYWNSCLRWYWVASWHAEHFRSSETLARILSFKCGRNMFAAYVNARMTRMISQQHARIKNISHYEVEVSQKK